MFEKEAKEYREERQNKGYYFVSQEMEQIELDDIVEATFKDSAEFGYNKANEWHDLKKNPNDLPKENDVYLVIVGSDGTKYRSLERYYLDTKEWSTVCNILFWKEIVLPKEEQNGI